MHVDAGFLPSRENVLVQRDAGRLEVVHGTPDEDVPHALDDRVRRHETALGGCVPLQRAVRPAEDRRQRLQRQPEAPAQVVEDCPVVYVIPFESKGPGGARPSVSCWHRDQAALSTPTTSET